MRKSLILLVALVIFVMPQFAFSGILGGDTLINTQGQEQEQQQGQIQGQAQDQHQDQGQLQGQGQSQNMVGSNNANQKTSVEQTVITKRGFTDISTVQGELPRPFQGRVEVIGEDKIGETWSQKGGGLDFKPDYVKVIFWSTKSQVVKQLDKDRFSIWPAHIQYADAQGAIAAKYGNLYNKYGNKVVVKVELHDGWTGYGVSPSTTASANPSGNTGAMAGGFLSFAGGQSMAYVAIVYYLTK